MIKMICCLYIVEYYSAIKKKNNKIMSFGVTLMTLKIVILCEVSYRERQIPHFITYKWNLKEWYK